MLIITLVGCSVTIHKLPSSDEFYVEVLSEQSDMDFARKQALSEVNKAQSCEGKDVRITRESQVAGYEFKFFLECYDKEAEEEALRNRLAEGERVKKLRELENQMKLEVVIEKCSKGNKEECLNLIKFGELSKNNDIILSSYLHLCVEGDNTDLDHCFKLANLALKMEQMDILENAARIGCKYLEGRLCALLFSIQKNKGRKNIAIKVFSIAAQLIKDECEHGFENSCRSSEILASECYAELLECKDLKLFNNKHKLEQTSLAKDEKYKEEMLRIERSKAFSASELVDEVSMARHEERSHQLQMLNAVNQVSNTISNIPKSIKSASETFDTGLQRFQNSLIYSPLPTFNHPVSNSPSRTHCETRSNLSGSALETDCSTGH